MKSRKSQKVRIEDSAYLKVVALAEAQGRSRTDVVNEALELGLERMTSPQAGASRDLARIQSIASEARSAAREAQAASLGAMALTCWMLPSLFGQKENDTAFGEYIASKSPADLYDAGICFKDGIKEGKTYHTVLRDIPSQVGFDTNEFAGVPRQEWRRRCEDEDRRRRAGGGDKPGNQGAKPRNRGKRK